MKRKVAIPLAIVAFFLAAGWTRNKLAADRQGEWVRVTRGDLVAGVDVTGTLAALDSGSFGPPDFNAAAFRYDGGNLALQGSLTY